MDPYNPIIAARAPQPSRRVGLDALPVPFWLALQSLALWPVFVWAGRRMADGSDEPLGFVALVLLALAALNGRLACRRDARTPWLAVALALTIAATVLAALLPPLATALIGMLAIGCAWAAFRAERAAVLPVLGLLLLALPLIASLQFYAGYPLRWLTAQCSAVLLPLVGVAAEPSGASLVVAGRLVIVDAPCSGVQLVWLGYAAACAAALWFGLRDGTFVRRLPWVALTVFAGNVLRNTVLVAKEAGLLAWPAWSHDVVGLVVLALVCIAVVALMRKAP
jgi:exosortase/archaeosortase family protein